MYRNAPHAAGARALAALALSLVLPSPAAALPLISEVFYDASGSDDGQSFIELAGSPDPALEVVVDDGSDPDHARIDDGKTFGGCLKGKVRFDEDRLEKWFKSREGVEFRRKKNGKGF